MDSFLTYNLGMIVLSWVVMILGALALLGNVATYRSRSINGGDVAQLSRLLKIVGYGLVVGWYAYLLFGYHGTVGPAVAKLAFAFVAASDALGSLYRIIRLVQIESGTSVQAAEHAHG